SAILAPLVAAGALVPRRSREAAVRFLVPVSAMPALAVALFAADDARAQFDWLLLGAHLGFEGAGRVLLVLTAALWAAAGLSAALHFALDPRRARFMAFFAVTMAGNIGLVAAQDIATFYLGFALMPFCAYGLVVHRADEEA